MSELDFATYANLPDIQKRQLCIELLHEFGAEVVHETTKGELQHACTLPLGGHTDHDSVTASLPHRKITFACFVCQNKGGLLWWIAVNRRESVESSKAWLKNTVGASGALELSTLMDVLDELFHPRREHRVMPSFDERVLDQWTHWKIFHPYLTLPVAEGGREIPEKTLAAFRVGYCDDDPDWGYYQRIIIPLRWRGKLVGWQARRLAPDDPEPAKYKNSPDVPRDRILFGTETALNGRQAVVVESPMSVLRHAHHLPLVATLGASVSDLQVPLLHRYERVVIWLDNDKAGWTALTGTRNSPGLIERLRPYVEVRVVDSPYRVADPADLAEDEAEELVAQAVPASIWRPPDPAGLRDYVR